MSFAYLVYASAWLKRYHPAAFCAALLNAQPMGFYSPQSLVDDARRHGVTVRRPDINASDATATLERRRTAAAERPTGHRSHRPGGGSAGRWSGWGCPSVRTLGDRRGRADRGATGRRRPVPRHGRPGPPGRAVPPPHLEALATADAFACFGLSPAGGAVGGRRGGAGDGPTGCPARPRASTRRCCPAWTAIERMVADVWATGLSPDAIRPSSPGRCSTGSARCRSPGCARSSTGAGAGRRHRHPPAAAGDRGRHHLPQPGGRDRHAQRRLLAGPVAAVPAGRPDRRRRWWSGGSWSRSTGWSTCAPTTRAADPAGPPGVPRLPLTAPDGRRCDARTAEDHALACGIMETLAAAAPRRRHGRPRKDIDARFHLVSDRSHDSRIPGWRARPSGGCRGAGTTCPASSSPVPSGTG